jgi:hypothetical protein
VQRLASYPAWLLCMTASVTRSLQEYQLEERKEHIQLLEKQWEIACDRIVDEEYDFLYMSAAITGRFGENVQILRSDIDDHRSIVTKSKCTALFEVCGSTSLHVLSLD